MQQCLPEREQHRRKCPLALDMIDQMVDWGLRPPLIVADAGYGDATEFRLGLAERAMPFVVQIASTITAYPGQVWFAATTSSTPLPPR